MARRPRLPLILALAPLLLSAIAGCSSYDAFDGRIANYTHTEQVYQVLVTRQGMLGEREIWNKTVPVQPLGTFYMGRVSTREGNYSITATLQDGTLVHDSIHFRHRTGPADFLINTQDNGTQIVFLYR